MRNVSLICCIFLAIGVTACAPISQNPKASAPTVISTSEVKQIVAKHIAESEYYQQYYALNSAKFDSRVNDISMTDPILVRNISGSIGVPEYYYVVHGIMPDGQLLAGEAINAIDGSFIEGKVWLEDVDTRLISKAEAANYARSINPTISADSLEPVFVYDSSVFSVSPLLSWKYCITQGSLGKSLATNTILVDPFVKKFKTSNVVTSKNANMSSIGYFHRAFKLASDAFNGRAIQSTAGALAPID